MRQLQRPPARTRKPTATVGPAHPALRPAALLVLETAGLRIPP
jgi:hypothetical protein